MNTAQSSGKHELNRTMGVVQATCMVAGIIIGASIFVQPSVITSAVPSVGGVTLAWTLAGVLTLVGCLISAELASAYPQTGGVYVFLREGFGPAVGFLWGWAMFWTMHSGIVAAIAMIFARYVGYFVPLGDLAGRGVAIGCIAVLTAVNYLGVKQGSRLQTAVTVGKVAAVLVLVAAGFALGKPAPTGAAVPAAGGSLHNLLLAVVAGLFAFGGWHMVTYAAEETVDAERTIPRALVAGTILVTLCYVALNAAYLYVLPISTVAKSTRIAADAANAVFGGGGGALMAALVIFSTFGAVNGIILAGPRVYLSMARDGLIFSWAGHIHPTHRTPDRALIAQGMWSSVLVLTGSYRALFTMVVYTEWIFFALMAVALFRLRRRADYAPAFRMPGYPMLPLLFVAACAIVVINQIAARPGEAALGLVLVLLGLPVYLLVVRKPSLARSTVGHAD